MKSALFAAALALTGLALAPAAHAQATCDQVVGLIGEAIEDFAGITGEEVDDSRYESTFMLPGASRCTIDADWDAAFTCVWEFTTEAALSSFHDSQTAVLRACLDGETWTESAMEPGEAEGWRLIRGVYFSASDDDAAMTFFNRADAASDGSTYEAEVSVTMVYF